MYFDSFSKSTMEAREKTLVRLANVNGRVHFPTLRVNPSGPLGPTIVLPLPLLITDPTQLDRTKVKVKTDMKAPEPPKVRVNTFMEPTVSTLIEPRARMTSFVESKVSGPDNELDTADSGFSSKSSTSWSSVQSNGNFVFRQDIPFTPQPKFMQNPAKFSLNAQEFVKRNKNRLQQRRASVDVACISQTMRYRQQEICKQQPKGKLARNVFVSQSQDLSMDGKTVSFNERELSETVKREKTTVDLRSVHHRRNTLATSVRGNSNQPPRPKRRSLVKSESAPVLKTENHEGHDHDEERPKFGRECTCPRLPAIPKPPPRPVLKRRNSEIVIKKTTEVPKRRASVDQTYRPPVVPVPRAKTFIQPMRPMKEAFLKIEQTLEPISKSPEQSPRPVSCKSRPRSVRLKTPKPTTPRPKTPKPKTPKTRKPKRPRSMNITVSPEEFELLRKQFRRLDTDMDGHLNSKEVISNLDKHLNQDQRDYLKQVYQVANSHTFFGLDEFITMEKLGEHLKTFEPTEYVTESYRKLNAVSIRNAIVRYSNIFLTLDERNRGKIDLESFVDILYLTAQIEDSREEFLERICFQLGIDEDATFSKLDYLVYIPYFLSLEEWKSPKRGRSDSILEMEPVPTT